MVQEHDLDVIVIGGGISGLATAWNLSQKGLSVQVWERTNRAGGKIKTDQRDGFTTEQAASMVMNFRPEVDHFFQQTGLEQFKTERLLDSQSKRYLIHQGGLQPLPMTIGRLFFSSLWSRSGKFRLLMEPFITSSRKEDESVSDFITRRFGTEFLEKAMEPFISGTMASDPDLASARHVIPRLTALEKRFGSITAGIIAHKIMGKRTARNPESFSFNGGMETLTRQLADNPAIGFQGNTEVKTVIQHAPFHWEIQAQTASGNISRTARHVVISSPADNAAHLLKPLNPSLSQLLSNIDYAPLSVVHIGLERSAVQHPLDSTGFLVPRQENMAINGNLWMSSVFANRAPENKVLLSSYLGGSRHPSAIKLSADASIDRVMKDIKPLLSISGTPIMGKVDKHQRALPLYHGQYHKTLSEIVRHLHAMPGLHLEANYKGGVSIRDRIVAAQSAAARIAEQLSIQSEHMNKTVFYQPVIEPLTESLTNKPA